MSSKTCLLCGRALGRMRPGAGAEFCSREHRNEYRLRRSMDCLTEANKVSTLARRRENPKSLTTEPVSSGVHSVPEPILAGPRIGVRPLEHPLLNGLGTHLGLRLGFTRAGLRTLETWRAPSGADPGGRRLAGGSVPVLSQSPAGALRRNARVSERLHFAPATARVFRNVRPDPRLGNALRVSAQKGFRLRDPQVRALPSRSAAPMMNAGAGARAVESIPVSAASGPRPCAAPILTSTIPEVVVNLRHAITAATLRAPSTPLEIPAATALSLRSAPRGAGVSAIEPPFTVLEKHFDMEAPSLPALRIARLRGVTQSASAGRSLGRLLFGPLSFSGTPDSPAEFGWTGISGQEYGR